ncbi:MAG TPA: hypothetical protein VGD84_13735, partial [Pseudonocardiaceae bacterium]
MAGQLTRRRFVTAVGGLALGVAGLSTPARALSTGSPAAGDQVAAAYYQLLLRHTNWVEQQWD